MRSTHYCTTMHWMFIRTFRLLWLAVLCMLYWSGDKSLKTKKRKHANWTPYQSKSLPDEPEEPVAYERILAIENLSDVPNPWKGFTMNRCLVLALVVLLVSSGINELHGVMDSVIEDTGVMSFVGSLQDGSLFQISIGDYLKWPWGSEEVGVIRRRKKPMGSKTILKPKAKE
ncbi:uncharacterized protein V6R79_015816 [Siganus canaliculatus]